MRVLITGGAGYLGTTVIKEMIEREDEVVSIDNLYRGDYKHLAQYKGNTNLRMNVGDISSPEKIKKALKDNKKLDAIIHLAAIPGLKRCLKDPKRAVLTNVLGTFNVLEIAREYDAGKLIFASSAAVYGVPETSPIPEEHPLNPINLYGVTKLDGEKLISAYNRNYGLPTIILRFGNLYGVGLFTYWETVIPKFVRQAMEKKPLTVYGNGEQARDFVHVADISKAILLSMQSNSSGEIFNIGSGRSISVNTVAKTVSEEVKKRHGLKVEIIHLPPRQGEPYVEDFSYSTEKIQDKLGFMTERSIKEGVIETVEYYFSLKDEIE